MSNIKTTASSWDTYFMSLAYMVSMKSKDTSTRVGAVIVGQDNEIRATGYNGFPRYIKDTQSRYNDKEYKYITSNHAEENAIIQCAKIGVSSKGCAIYTPWMPCARCAKMIIQAGITKVIFDTNFPGNNIELQGNWQYSMSISKEMLDESQIEVLSFNGKITNIKGLYKEKEFDVYDNIIVDSLIK